MTHVSHIKSFLDDWCEFLTFSQGKSRSVFIFHHIWVIRQQLLYIFMPRHVGTVRCSITIWGLCLKALTSYFLNQLLTIINGILYERAIVCQSCNGFDCFSFTLCFPCWFGVGGAQMRKGDIMYFKAPIRISQYLNQIWWLMSCLITVHLIKPHPHPWWSRSVFNSVFLDVDCCYFNVIEKKT